MSAMTTLIFDMYGVILKERTGNFETYTYEHFPKSEYECLFIDDSFVNITAALELGIHSVLFNRFYEVYSGEQVNSFDELDKMFENL